MTEFMTYRPCSQEVFVDLVSNFGKKQGEALAACILRLWNTGVGRAPGGRGLWVFTERSRGVACKTPF